MVPPNHHLAPIGVDAMRASINRAGKAGFLIGASIVTLYPFPAIKGIFITICWINFDDSDPAANTKLFPDHD